VQHPALVGGDLDVLDQRRVAPDADAVVGEARRRRDLLVVGAPLQAGDLAAGVDGVDARPRCRVPEVDVAVVRAAARRQQVELPRAPAQRLDRRVVVRLLELGRLQSARVPDRHQVVVAARCQLRAIATPFQATHFASMRLQLSDLVRGDTHVVVEEPAIASTRREKMFVPTWMNNVRYIETSITKRRWDLLITLTLVSCPNMLRSLVPSSTSQI